MNDIKEKEIETINSINGLYERIHLTAERKIILNNIIVDILSNDKYITNLSLIDAILFLQNKLTKTKTKKLSKESAKQLYLLDNYIQNYNKNNDNDYKKVLQWINNQWNKYYSLNQILD